MASLGATRPFHALVELARPPPPAREGLLDVDEMMYALGLTADEVPAQVEDDDELDDDDEKENQDETTALAPPAAPARNHGASTTTKAQRTLSQPAPKPSAAAADKVRPPSPSWADGPPTKRRRSRAFQSGPRFRKWPPYSREEPYTDTPTGLRIHFPLFDDKHSDPGLIGDLAHEEILAAVERILEVNKSVHGNHKYALDDVEPAKLAQLLALLPIELLQSPSAGPVAFQPLSGTKLNVEIAAKQRQSLSYYFYLIETFLERREDADSFLNFAASDGALAAADGAGQRRKYEAWLVGLRKFIDEGGWEGQLKRITSYSGESDGWDVPVGENESLSARVFAHFVGPDAASHLSLHKIQLRTLSTFLEANPGIKSLSTVSFMCTAAELDPSAFNVVDIKALEAVISVLRHSPTDCGGSNVSSCGQVDHVADMLKTVASFSPGTPISALRDLAEVPASLSLGLVAKFVPGTTCAEAKAAMTNSQQPGRRGRRPRSSTIADAEGTNGERTRSVKNPRFAGGGHAALDLNPSSALVQRLRDEYDDSAPLPDVRLCDPDAETLAPYQDEQFYPALVSLSLAAKKPLPPVITQANIRTGVELYLIDQSIGLTTTREQDRRRRRLRFVLAHGKRAASGFITVRSEEEAGPVTIEFEEEWQTVSLLRDGEALLVYEGAGSPTEQVAEYDVTEIISRTTAPRTGCGADDRRMRRKATEQRKEALEELWGRILAG